MGIRSLYVVRFQTEAAQDSDDYIVKGASFSWKVLDAPTLAKELRELADHLMANHERNPLLQKKSK